MSKFENRNLKKIILKKAISKLNHIKIQDLSLREIAREIGVSKNAPYKHYRNKDDLIVEIATWGFNKLTNEMKKSIIQGTSVSSKISSIGKVYIQFARKNSSIYQLMFKLNNDNIPKESNFIESSEKSFNLLHRLILEGIKSGEFAQQDPLKASLSTWAYIHGISLLLIDKVDIPHDKSFDEIFLGDFIFHGLKKI